MDDLCHAKLLQRFAEARPGEPFLLVLKLVERGGGGPLARDTLKVKVWVGVLNACDCGATVSKSDLVIGTATRVALERSVCVVSGPLRVPLFAFADTPLEPYSVPSSCFLLPFDLQSAGKIRAVEFVVGLEQIETQLLKDKYLFSEFRARYLCARRMLSFPLVSSGIREVQAAEEGRVAKELLGLHRKALDQKKQIDRVARHIGDVMVEGDARVIITDKDAARVVTSGNRALVAELSNRIRDLLAFAIDIGMDEMSTPVPGNDGLRYVPKLLLEDLAGIYGPEETMQI